MKRIIVTVGVLLLFVACPFLVKAEEPQRLPGQELADELLDNTPDYAKKLGKRLKADRF